MRSPARNALGLLLALTAASLLPACSSSTAKVPHTPQIEKTIGLPVYPGATPMGDDTESTTNTPVGAMTTITAGFETTHSFEAVKAYYDRRSPASKRQISLPFGGRIKDETVQFVSGSAQKQISLVEVRGVTMIMLSSTNLKFERPSPSPAASAPR
ncbi:MAG: hypothetical protein JO347_07175 [Candidatus Eremiobacteraeota bacterium]|nr:hypothetical protein [Candidatus Eremiobacteraeota bacterium]MBV8281830.1 hypothetical protein [Candidatus Eremiobacteraeota bacterium]